MFKALLEMESQDFVEVNKTLQLVFNGAIQSDCRQMENEKVSVRMNGIQDAIGKVCEALQAFLPNMFGQRVSLNSEDFATMKEAMEQAGKITVVMANNVMKRLSALEKHLGIDPEPDGESGAEAETGEESQNGETPADSGQPGNNAETTDADGNK